MDDDLYYGCGHRHKRTRAHMEGDGSSTWGSPFRRLRTTSEESSSSPQRGLTQLGRPPRTLGQRYSGDGMDYRRPISSMSNAAEHAVIDLTEDDAGPSRPPAPAEARSTRAARPPRYHRDIIAIEEDDTPEQSTLRVPEGSTRVPESPEVEFISARTIDPPHRPPPNHRPADIDLTDEDFEIYAIHGDQDVREGPFGTRAALDMALGRQMDNLLRAEEIRQRFIGGLGFRRMMERPEPEPRRPGRPVRRENIVRFAAPDLNFAAVGFDLGLEMERPPPPPPTYNPPDAAPKGFTRSPVEDEVLICPNCEDELCSGDTDIKKQVWIVKACGHVYCGDCADNRQVKKRKPREKAGEILPPAFKTCVVEGCGKKVQSRTAMIQIYL